MSIFDIAAGIISDAGSKYGPLLTTVKGVGFLLAATFTISLGWMKRSGSRWAPPAEAVPKATTRFASVITAVLLAVFYVFLHQPDRAAMLTLLTFLALLLAAVGLFSTIYLIKAYGFEAKRKGWFGRQITDIKIGGSQLTYDASEAQRLRHVEVDRLFVEAQGDLSLIFKKPSIARVHVLLTISFLTFLSFGSLALAGAGLLLNPS